MAKIPVSVCLIAKNEARNLTEFHKALKPFLVHPQDEVVLVDTGSTDKTERVARSLKYRVYSHPEFQSEELSELGRKWLPEEFEEFSKQPHFDGGLLTSFAAARNKSFEYANNEVCVWLDLDDELVGPEAFRQAIDAVFANGNRGALFLRYDYAFTPTGEVQTQLWRERAVTRSDFVWKGLCHETLIPNDPSGRGLILARDPALPVSVKHRAPKPHKFSDLRNYIVLRNDLEVLGNFDARTLFYLGNATRGLGRHEEALNWYGRFVDKTGNRDDPMAAWLSMASCYVSLGRHWRSLKMCQEASLVSPEDPRPHYWAAHVWGQMGNWKNVVSCVKLGDQFEQPDTLHAVEPILNNFQPPALLAVAYREMEMPEAAMEAAQRAIAARPSMVEWYQDMERWAKAEQLSHAVLTAVAYSKEPQKVLEHVQLSPHLLKRGYGTPEKTAPGMADGKRTVCFWCGQAMEEWGPKSGEAGIGASEKMVIVMAEALAKRGFNVQVYATLNCPEGEYNGVHWRYTGHFNPRIYRDSVVVWRVPGVVDKIGFNAGKVFVWMHDVGCNDWWTPAILALVDKVFFLSQYQRSLHPAVPEDKVFYTKNGIPFDAFRYDGRKKERKIMFISSPDRGAVRVMSAFRASGLEQQGWTLHIGYGFGPMYDKLAAKSGFGHIVELERDMSYYYYKDMVLQTAAATPGVVYRGRMSWSEVAEELKSAAIWFYPTNFSEISCVAAMEAQAAGCKAVCTLTAALKETMDGYPGLFVVPGGDPNFGVEKLVEAARTPYDAPACAGWAEKFDIGKLANQWTELFNEPTEQDDGNTEDAGAGGQPPH